jgi:hypothetical protein
MPIHPPFWSDRLARTLSRYDEALLRSVAGRLARPRGHWPVEEVVKRCADTLDNPVVLDRRIQDLAPASRGLLAAIGHSGQPAWTLGNLVEVTLALGHPDGLEPIFDLLGAGLLFTDLGEDRAASPASAPGVKVRNFEQWLGTAGPAGLSAFTLPEVAARARGADLGLPDLSEAAEQPPGLREMEADGLEWLLRLGVLWQQACAGPFRRTQQGGLFKRDVERLEQDPLLNGPPPDRLADVRDPGFLLACLAEQVGVLQPADGELRAGALPASWDEGLPQALVSLWVELHRLRGWTPRDGWRAGEPVASNPFASAVLLAFLLLGRLRPGAWVAPDVIEQWLLDHHPYWAGESMRPSRQQPWLGNFLLGVAYPMRLLQAAALPAGGHVVRLSALGRWVLGLGEPPPPPPVFKQTLLVQPTLEIVAFRQGLTPALLARLTRFATWKTLGSACTLQLEPQTVYRALESGETFESIRLALEQHSTRAIPSAVLDSLRTWSNKRDRITVYPSATLLEFATATDLDEALARGLAAVRVADTVAVVPSEDDIEFRHFRLTGTRDYALPPDRCVSVEEDGVTLTVDAARSDLMLETELPRFAEMVGRPGSNGRRQYRLTPASLAAARASGWGLNTLETWFQQRTGQPVSPAARLLLAGAQVAEPRLSRRLVLQVALPEVADGLVQWPATRALIAERLGPMALSVAEEDLPALLRALEAIGVSVPGEGTAQP